LEGKVGSSILMIQEEALRYGGRGQCVSGLAWRTCLDPASHSKSRSSLCDISWRSTSAACDGSIFVRPTGFHGLGCRAIGPLGGKLWCSCSRRPTSPDTVKRFRDHWARSSRTGKPGRPAINNELRELIRQISGANPL